MFFMRVSLVIEFEYLGEGGVGYINNGTVEKWGWLKKKGGEGGGL